MNDISSSTSSLRRIAAVSFSPCGGTRQRLHQLCEKLSQQLSLPVDYIDYTLPTHRTVLPPFERECLLVWASPVYAGRLPNKLTDYVLSNLRGNGCPFVGLVSYGNRSEGDALAELVGIARRGGCRPVAAAAVAVRHVFSPQVGANRPTAEDDAQLDQFASHVATYLLVPSTASLPPFGCEEPTAFYQPLRSDGEPARFLKAMPTVDNLRCVGCGRCAQVCPMDSVAMEGKYPTFSGICIKCQACIHACDAHAIAIEQADFLSHVAMLEHHFAAPADNRFWLL